MHYVCVIGFYFYCEGMCDNFNVPFVISGVHLKCGYVFLQYAIKCAHLFFHKIIKRLYVIHLFEFIVCLLVHVKDRTLNFHILRSQLNSVVSQKKKLNSVKLFLID